MNILRIVTEDFLKIKQFLTQEEGKEQFVFILCKKMLKTRDKTIYLATEIIFPDKQDMKAHSSCYVEPTTEFQLQVYGIAAEKDLYIFDFHNHWFSQVPKFSGTDTEAALENGKFIAQHIPNTGFGLAVFNQGINAYSGMVFNKKSQAFSALDSIEILGSPTEILFNENQPKNSTDEKYSRHYIIPGWKQDKLPDLNVDVIGLGGIGAIVDQALASIGVGEGKGSITLIDPDTIEKSNLPRIPYASEKDIGKPKVKIAKKYIRFKNPKASVTTLATGVQDAKAQELIKQAHIVFGCVDSEGARKILTQTCHEAAIPYIDLGTEIIPEENTYHAGGQVRVMIPRKGCLFCIGGIDQTEATRDLLTDEQRAEQERAGYIRGTKETPTPSVMHLNGVIANLGISQFLKVIFGESIEKQKAIFYDQQKMSLLPAGFERQKNCPLCGEKPTEEETQKNIEELRKNLSTGKLATDLQDNFEWKPLPEATMD